MKLYFLPEDVATNEEISLTLELGPPPEDFKTKDDAHDWVLVNMPRGLYYEIHDKLGRKLWPNKETYARRKNKRVA